jgi:hypothetical protein
MAIKFAMVGQRVRINSSGESKVQGKVGTIRTLPTGNASQFGVELDDFHSGHSLRGNIEGNSGWYIFPHALDAVDECGYGKIKPDPKIGIGGAPTRATTFPPDAAGRKKCPVASGVLDYFPDALIAVSQVSFAGNEQHNPGQPLNWARGKSQDQDDTIARHFLQRGTLDDDGQRHSAKLAWRALALLQIEIEQEKKS